MSNFETPMAQELEVYIELVRSKMEGADPMEASDLWGQMKQLQKLKTWLHYWEGLNKKR